MKFRLEIFALLIFFAALYAAYFFIRHSYIIVSLAPVLGILVVAMIVALGLGLLAFRLRSRS
jgi:hypothetical protein